MGIGKTTRRAFLIGSAAIVGGIAIGGYVVSRPAPNPLHPEEGATLNPFVLIDQRGVTIITPRAEMGQGVHSMLAMLVAEEMDLDWQDIRIEHGPPAKAYYNSALLKNALPIHAYAASDLQNTIRDVVGHAGKLLNLQVTGGSTSTVDAWDRFRMAGATAREALKEAAAKQLGVSASALKTENGAVIAPDGTRLPYADLAVAAAEVSPAKPALRTPDQWRYIGKSVPRLDQPAKANGSARFGIDTKLDGMRFATVRINPRLGGKMASYDDSAAAKMAGVEKIIPLEDGVAVVASNTWLAFQAADAVQITWEDAPFPPQQDQIWQGLEAAFDTEANATGREDGDVDSLPAGATMLEAEYRAPFLAHAAMEPMNATAIYKDGSLAIWVGHQAPIAARDMAAAAIGIDSENVAIHTTIMGGAFGRRGEIDVPVYAAKIAAAMPGVPVKMTWTREEDMRHDFYRPATTARYRGAVQDGKAVMVDGKIAGISCAHQAMGRMTGISMGGPDTAMLEGAADQPYAIPNYRIRGYLSDMSVPVGFWRSVGASHNGFQFDCFLDEMAHAAGTDPLTFRLEMARDEHAPSARVIETVRDMSGWTGKTPDGVGRGVAFCMSFGTPVAQVIEVRDEDGLIRISNAWIACDPGIALDPRNIEAQMSGGLIYGLSAAIMGEITFDGGEVDQWNFPDYDAVRMHNVPQIAVQIIEGGGPIAGVGEPGTPPAAAALANALFDLTGKRVRDLPLNKHFDFA